MNFVKILDLFNKASEQCLSAIGPSYMNIAVFLILFFIIFVYLDMDQLLEIIHGGNRAQLPERDYDLSTVKRIRGRCHRCCQKGHKSTDCYKFMHHAELAAAMRKEAQEETMAALKN